jgi:hypothetical protein
VKVRIPTVLHRMGLEYDAVYDEDTASLIDLFHVSYPFTLP